MNASYARIFSPKLIRRTDTFFLLLTVNSSQGAALTRSAHVVIKLSFLTRYTFLAIKERNFGRTIYTLFQVDIINLIVWAKDASSDFSVKIPGMITCYTLVSCPIFFIRRTDTLFQLITVDSS